ncbi:hypothetical protein SAY87_009401 [Trapa incisa]|uniref:Uncharacterized protein n=1 Tax=Trapa incisa TaxID=236973 RepID=A0AAN7PXR2_9MYRT|nr:hypothetical protein SAY87_009401 [Trapa incisa]
MCNYMQLDLMVAVIVAPVGGGRSPFSCSHISFAGSGCRSRGTVFLSFTACRYRRFVVFRQFISGIEILPKCCHPASLLLSSCLIDVCETTCFSILSRDLLLSPLYVLSIEISEGGVA